MICLSFLDSINSICGSFQGTAFQASVSLLLPKELYDQGNGLIELGDGITNPCKKIIKGISALISPALAGFLMSAVGLNFVLSIDILTCLIAIITVSVLVTFPNLPPAAENRDSRTWEEVTVGWRSFCSLSQK